MSARNRNRNRNLNRAYEKQVIYHPYGGVSNRFDYRTFPAYSGSGYGYNSHPAPYIKTGLEYTIGDQGYGQQYGQQHGQQYGGSY